MINTLDELYDNYNYNKYNINDYIIYEKEILDIFNNHNVNKYKEIDELFLWIGRYYYEIEKNYDKMKEYYLMTIEKGKSIAMFNLGLYYDEIEKNYDKMKEYYLMAIEKGHNGAMNNLGVYYYKIKKNEIIYILTKLIYILY